MRYGFIAALAAFAVCLAPAVKADDAPKDVKGLFLMSDYPAVTLRPGETSTVSLRLQNYDIAPERLALSVSGVPTGWTATLLGGGQPVAAAMPATNSSVSLSLRLDDFYLFHDCECDRFSVVYRRRGYDYGVIRLVEE